MDRYTMKQLPDLERPYEKLELYGESTLSNAELLAIIIKTGTRSETALQLAQRVLNECDINGNKFSLKNVSLDRLTSIKGIGRVKAILLKAVFELSNRVNSDISEKPFLAKFDLASNYLMKELKNEKQEKLKVLCLNIRGNLEKIETIYIGGINGMNVSAREVFRIPIECGCCNIIIAHNHPSGDPTPSTDDINFTKNVIAIGRALEIELLDHIIIGDGKYISIRELKLLNW